MGILKRCWTFLLDKNNRAVLAFIGTALAALVGGSWVVYKHFSDKNDSTETQTVLPKEVYKILLKSWVEENSKEFGVNLQNEAEPAGKAALEQKSSHLKKSIKEPEKIGSDTDKPQDGKLAETILPSQIAQAKKAIQEGKPELAESLLEEVVASASQKAAEASYQLGLLAKDRIDFEAAWQAFTRAVQLASDNSLYLNEAGFMAQTLGHYDQAVKYYEKSLAITLKIYGPERPEVASNWINLGAAWDDKGEYDKAIEYYEKALASDLKTFGPEHPNVARNWNNLGTAWNARGENDKAIEYYEKALASNLKTFGPEHPDVARNWNNLGAAWDDKGEHDKAIEYYEKALASALKTFGPENPYVAISWNNLGVAWDAKGETNKAIEYYEKSLASDLMIFGPDHPDVAKKLNNLGAAWNAKGEHNKAIEYFEKALAVFKNAGLENEASVVEANIQMRHKKQ